MPFCCGASGKEMKEDIVVSPKSLKEPKPTLTYFNLPARAEAIRLTFAAGGIDFVDQRFEFPELPNYASKSPTHKFPIMELDKKIYCESLALLEYAAHRAFLLPTDDLERLKADEVVHFLSSEFLPSFRNYFRAMDDSSREQAMNEINQVSLPKVLPQLEKIVGHNSHSKYVVGSNMSMADIAIYSALEHSPAGNKVKEICQQDCPRLLEIHAEVSKNPNIKNYESKQ